MIYDMAINRIIPKNNYTLDDQFKECYEYVMDEYNKTSIESNGDRSLVCFVISVNDRDAVQCFHETAARRVAGMWADNGWFCWSEHDITGAITQFVISSRPSWNKVNYIKK